MNDGRNQQEEDTLGPFSKKRHIYNSAGGDGTPFVGLNAATRAETQAGAASKNKLKEDNEFYSSSSSRRSIPSPLENGDTISSISSLVNSSPLSRQQLPPAPRTVASSSYNNMGITPSESAILQRWEQERAGVLPSLLQYLPNVTSTDVSNLHQRAMTESHLQTPALDQTQLPLLLSSRRRNTADPLSVYRSGGPAGGGSLLSSSNNTSRTTGHLLDWHGNTSQLPTNRQPGFGGGLNHNHLLLAAGIPPSSNLNYPSTLQHAPLGGHLQAELSRLISHREGDRQLLLQHRLASPQSRLLPSSSSLLHLPPFPLASGLMAGQGLGGMSEQLRTSMAAYVPPPLAPWPDSLGYTNVRARSSMLASSLGNAIVVDTVGNNRRSPAFSAPRSHTFPMILHAALLELEQTESANVASFLPDGKSFQVKSQFWFEKSVLPAFFPKMKGFASFQRQLNLYDFERVGGGGTDRGAYQHALFVRDSPSLTIEMKRTKIKGGTARGSRASRQGDSATIDTNASEEHGASLNEVGNEQDSIVGPDRSRLSADKKKV